MYLYGESAGQNENKFNIKGNANILNWDKNIKQFGIIEIKNINLYKTKYIYSFKLIINF